MKFDDYQVEEIVAACRRVSARSSILISMEARQTLARAADEIEDLRRRLEVQETKPEETPGDHP